MEKIGIMLLSGGLDSTTVAAYALRQGYQLTGLTFHYGQRHNREIAAAAEVARILKIKHEVLDILFFKRLAWYSALTSSADFALPRNRKLTEMTREIPITYVPLRNTFFITMAAAYLESQALYEIENKKRDPQQISASIFIAANAIDYSGYPDCRPEFYAQISKTLFLGSKLGTQYGRAISAETPIIALSKAEIIKLGFDLKAPLANTWSCYEGGEAPCGHCDSCVLRAAGFKEAGIDDPLLTRLAKRKYHAEGE